MAKKEFDKESYQQTIDNWAIEKIQKEYLLLSAQKENDTIIIKKSVIEKILFEYGTRKELPETFAWDLLQDAVLHAKVIEVMPNKAFRKVIVQARLFNADILLHGFVNVGKLGLSAFPVGTFVSVKFTNKFRCFELGKN